MATLLLDRNRVSSLLDMPDVIKVVEQAFRDWADGKAKMPSKAYLILSKGDFRAMPAALPGAAGVKWVNVHPHNPSRGLPTVMAIIILNDPETGCPLAVMDASDITAYRTGAAAAIASKYLARPDSDTLGIIGAGRQAYTQIAAHMHLFNIKLVKVFDISKPNVDRLIEYFSQYNIRPCSLEDTAASDIVCTLTPAREPYLKRRWIAAGTHINAVGADAEGKEELEPSILGEAVVVVDDMGQASAAGEINVPIAKGLFSAGDVYGTIAEIIAGRKRGRRDSGEITVFDATGVAIEDIAVAKIVYQKACREGDNLSVELI